MRTGRSYTIQSRPYVTSSQRLRGGKGSTYSARDMVVGQLNKYISNTAAALSPGSSSISSKRPIANADDESNRLETSPRSKLFQNITSIAASYLHGDHSKNYSIIPSPRGGLSPGSPISRSPSHSRPSSPSQKYPLSPTTSRPSSPLFRSGSPPGSPKMRHHSPLFVSDGSGSSFVSTGSFSRYRIRCVDDLSSFDCCKGIGGGYTPKQSSKKGHFFSQSPPRTKSNQTIKSPREKDSSPRTSPQRDEYDLDRRDRMDSYETEMLSPPPPPPPLSPRDDDRLLIEEISSPFKVDTETMPKKIDFNQISSKPSHDSQIEAVDMKGTEKIDMNALERDNRELDETAHPIPHEVDDIPSFKPFIPSKSNRIESNDLDNSQNKVTSDLIEDNEQRPSENVSGRSVDSKYRLISLQRYFHRWMTRKSHVVHLQRRYRGCDRFYDLSQLQIAFNKLLNHSIALNPSNSDDRPRDETMNSDDQVNNQTNGQVKSQVNDKPIMQVKNEVNSHTCYQEYSQVNNQVKNEANPVNSQVKGEVSGQSNDQRNSKANNQANSQLNDQIIGHISDKTYNQTSNQIKRHVNSQVDGEVNSDRNPLDHERSPAIHRTNHDISIQSSRLSSLVANNCRINPSPHLESSPGHRYDAIPQDRIKPSKSKANENELISLAISHYNMKYFQRWNLFVYKRVNIFYPLLDTAIHHHIRHRLQTAMKLFRNILKQKKLLKLKQRQRFQQRLQQNIEAIKTSKTLKVEKSKSTKKRLDLSNSIAIPVNETSYEKKKVSSSSILKKKGLDRDSLDENIIRRRRQRFGIRRWLRYHQSCQRQMQNALQADLYGPQCRMNQMRRGLQGFLQTMISSMIRKTSALTVQAVS